MGHPADGLTPTLLVLLAPKQIYWDGLLMATAVTRKTSPLQPGGALMLGAEQDCYGGCTDRREGRHSPARKACTRSVCQAVAAVLAGLSAA